MKLVTFRHGDLRARPGVLRGDDVIDLPHFPSMLALIDGGADSLSRARDLQANAPATCALKDATLLAPIPEPRSVRDFLCFEAHLRASVRASMALRYGAVVAGALGALGAFRPPARWRAQPLSYRGNRFSVVGTGADIVRPAGVKMLDYELEIAAVIGSRCRDVAKEHARAMIFGFTIFNDVSARDWQMREMGVGFHLGPSKSKDFDTGNVMGPVLVTADEIADPYALKMTARVNGEQWSEGSTRDMHWRFEDLVAHASRSETLHPGEVFGSGTVGTGCGLERGRFLADGDVVELEIEGIGVLKNRVTS